MSFSEAAIFNEMCVGFAGRGRRDIFLSRDGFGSCVAGFSCLVGAGVVLRMAENEGWCENSFKILRHIRFTSPENHGPCPVPPRPFLYIF